jgi:hypothetical protein
MKRLFQSLYLLVQQIEKLYVGRHLVSNSKDTIGTFFQAMVTEFVTSHQLDPRELFPEKLQNLFTKEVKTLSKAAQQDSAARRRLWQKEMQKRAALRQIHAKDKRASKPTKPHKTAKS